MTPETSYNPNVHLDPEPHITTGYLEGGQIYDPRRELLRKLDSWFFLAFLVTLFYVADTIVGWVP